MIALPTNGRTPDKSETCSEFSELGVVIFYEWLIVCSESTALDLVRSLFGLYELAGLPQTSESLLFLN